MYDPFAHPLGSQHGIVTVDQAFLEYIALAAKVLFIHVHLPSLK